MMSVRDSRNHSSKACAIFPIAILVSIISFAGCSKSDVTGTDNGNSKDTTDIVTEQFIFPAEVGTEWRYTFSMAYYSTSSYAEKITTGVHTWDLDSSSATTVDTTLYFKEVTNDTTSVHYTAGPWHDTTYVSFDTTFFTAIIGDSLIKLEYFQLPVIFNKYCTDKDTLVISPPDPTYKLYTTFILVNGVGVTYFHHGYTGNTALNIEMILIDKRQ